MKYLVTGVAGFIGSAVSERLCAAGHEVVGIDNLNDFDPASDEVLADVKKVNGTVVSSIGEFKADVSGLALASDVSDLNDISASDVWTYVSRSLTSESFSSLDRSKIQDIHDANFAKRTLSSNTITVYDADNTTVKTVLDVTKNPTTLEITEIKPQ